MATGTYVGDGAATQAIVGVGFQPRFVLIYPQTNALAGNTTMGYKTSSDPADWGSFFSAGIVGSYRLQDIIVSLDADGFTVGDGTGFANVLNVAATTFCYVCMA